MKKFGAILIILIIGVFFFLNPFRIQAFNGFENLLYYAPCSQPVTYSIGTIDSRFGITESELIEDLGEAEQAWEGTSGQNLFAYDPEADLKVNLVYDRRQDLSNQIYSLKDEIEEDKNTIKPEIEEYDRRSAAFQERLGGLNRQIEEWNDKGGAPEEEYNKLIEEQKLLQEEAQELNSQARQLNRTSDEFANKVGELNQTVNRFNSALSVRPEEGLYDPNKNLINIYFHTDPSEFVHTLAHELGHARGLGHTESVGSIMYLQTNQQVVPTSADIALLGSACEKKNYAEIAVERMQLLYDFYTNQNKAINRGEAS